MTPYINPPTDCDICGTPITNQFVDGATTTGPWGFMCPTCFPLYGRGLGLGKGQKYTKQDDGKYHKTGG